MTRCLRLALGVSFVFPGMAFRKSCLPKLVEGCREGRGERRMADGLLEAVRGLWLADPELGTKPLLAKLREQQPDLGAGNKEVREALT
eukprot:scaffold111720_cov51-Phaeocystis_antarctica.AAC.3